MKHSSNLRLLAVATLMAAMSFTAQAKKDPTTNPDAVPHQIDRSAMTVQIQGWTRDLKYPIYPITVVAGGSETYYTTKGDKVEYKEFSQVQLTCEIGQAPAEVLKNKAYKCSDGVCFSNTGGIIGTDPRIKAPARC